MVLQISHLAIWLYGIYLIYLRLTLKAFVDTIQLHGDRASRTGTVDPGCLRVKQSSYHTPLCKVRKFRAVAQDKLPRKGAEASGQAGVALMCRASGLRVDEETTSSSTN